MSQLSFSEAEYVGKRKQTRREKFLGEMDRTIPWDYLAGEVAKHYPRSGKVGRQPYPIETMLRIHFMQQWFALSDPAMEEALYDSHSMRRFAQLPGGRVPDETTILIFRHLLEAHDIAEGIFEGVTLFLQGALPGAGQEHRAAQDAVCPGQSVDGARAGDGRDGTGAFMRGKKAQKRAKSGVRAPDKPAFSSPLSA